MAQTQQGDEAKFRGLFEAPSVERIHSELGDTEFEHFVAYVFRQAGFGAEGVGGQHISGIDVKIYADAMASSPYVGAAQVKRYQVGNLVAAPDVNKLRGGVSRTGAQFGYVVTTSGFNAPAQAEFNGMPPLWPVDGEHLVRYINYIRGSYAALQQSGSGKLGSHGHTLAPFRPEVLLEADAIMRNASGNAKILTVANHKGGVGKTTTALNIAFGLAARDKQVLLVDLDAQANLTRALGYPVEKAAERHYIREYFDGVSTLPALVSRTQFPHVWLIPSHPDLIHADRGLGAGPEAEIALARDLSCSAVVPPPSMDKRPFDWIVIDTGPWMGFFTRSALAASRYAVMPLSPSAFADMGLNFLVDTVATMQALSGSPIDIIGCLVTQWKGDSLDKSLLAPVKNQLDDAGIGLFEARIPFDRSHIERAHLDTGKGKKRSLLDQRCASAEGYLKAVGEILDYVQSQRRDENASA